MGICCRKRQAINHTKANYSDVCSQSGVRWRGALRSFHREDWRPWRCSADIEEFFPGELAPGPPAALTPDFVEGSDAEVEAPEEVDGLLQLPEANRLTGVKLHFVKKPGPSVTWWLAHQRIPFVKHANVRRCLNQQNIIKGNRWLLNQLCSVTRWPHHCWSSYPQGCERRINWWR